MADTATSQPSVKPAQKIERAVIDANGAVTLSLPKEALRSVEIADVDLVLRFADGTDVVIPNGAIDALSGNAPTINFSDSQASSAELMKSAGKTAIVTAGNVRIITEELDTRATTSQDGGHQSGGDQSDAGRTSIPALPEIKPTTVSAPTKSGTEGSGSGQDATIEPIQVEIPTVYKQGVKVNGIENLPIKTPYTETSFYVSNEYKLYPSGTTEVPLGSRTSANNALTDQARTQTITGTSGNDIIGHNSAFTPRTSAWESTLHLDFPNFTELSSVTLTLDSAANAVAGMFFSSAQATRTGVNNWSLVLDANALTKGIDLLVRYNVAADGTSPNTQITMDVETFGKAGFFSFDLVKTLTFLYTNATKPEDFSQTTATGDPIYTLPAFGIGYKILAGDGNDTVYAGAGPDEVYGQAGSDILNGNSGNDSLDGGAGADTLDGGTGVNTASYADAGGNIIASLSAGTFGTVSFTDTGSGILNTDAGATLSGDAGGDQLANIQNLVGSDYNDILVGDANANVLTGGKGNDTLEGMAGADTLDGGDGTNTASYEHSTSAQGVVASLITGTFNGVKFVTESKGIRNQSSSSDAAGDLLINITNLTGSGNDDFLVGDSNGNILDGSGGNDTVSYAKSGDGVVVSLTTGTASGGDAQGDTLTSIENLIGSEANDTLIGSSANNSLLGGEGDDLLSGMAGADILNGGAGTANTASYASVSDSSGVVASLNTGSLINTTTNATVAFESIVGGGTLNKGDSTSAGDAGGDSLINIQNLIGSIHDDTLGGNDQANILNGGAGTDTVSYATAAGTDGVVASLTAGNFGGINFVDTGTGILNRSSSGEAAGNTLISIENLTGSNNDDLLVGSTVANRLDGGSGNDTVSYAGISGTGGIVASLTAGTFGGISFGDSGAGVLNGATTGDAAGDRLVSIENLIGSNNNDFLVGNTGANQLTGGKGNDTLQGFGGGDTLSGGEGINTVSYAGVAGTVSVSLLTGQGTVGFLTNTLSNIQNVIGSAGNDTLAGNSLANTLDGGSGGNDTVSYAAATGIDGIIASLTAGVFGGITFGDGGAGILNTATTGDAAGDRLISIENLTGSNNNDLLVGSNVANTLLGGKGDDTLQGMGGGDALDGGEGNNTVSYAGMAGPVTVSLLTGEGSVGGATDKLDNIQNIIGSASADTLTGNVASNLIVGGAGSDTINGGDEVDTVSYADSGSAVVASLMIGTYTNAAGTSVSFSSLSGGVKNDGTASTAGDAGGDTLINIENLTGSSKDDFLVGSNAVINTLSGGDGNDTLIGLGSGDTLDGGRGNNTVSYAGSAAVIASLSTGTFTSGSILFKLANGGILNMSSGSDASGDTLIGIQNLIGSGNADTLIGDTNANVLDGGLGNDVLEGKVGADTIYGNDGTDTASYATAGTGVFASLLAGTFSGGSFGTVTFESSSAGAYGTGILNKDTAGTISGDAGGDLLIGIENLTGSGYADYLIGNSAANVLDGGIGDDILSGGAGNDTLTGGAGSDTIDGGADNDTITAGAGADIITAGAGNDTVDAGTENDNISGGDGDDLITGGAGSDTINGGLGTDTLSYSGAGAAVISSLTSITNYRYLAAGSSTATTVSFTTDAATGGVKNNISTAGDATGDSISGIENLVGSTKNDVLIGSTANNLLEGGDGSDTLDGLSGASGSQDSDTASYANAGAAVAASLSAGTFATTTVGTTVVFTAASTGGVLNRGSVATAGQAAGDTLINIENLTGSSKKDTLVGDSKINVLDGGADDDILQGMGGADILYGGSGGTDTASYANAGAGVLASLQAGTFTGGAFNAIIVSKISTSYGGSLDGYQNDNANANTVAATDASGDVLIAIKNLTGSAFNDYLIGDATTANILDGGAGADILDGGGSTGDTVTYVNSVLGVTASLSAGTYNAVSFLSSAGGVLNQGDAITAGDAGGDTLISIRNLTGTTRNDTLAGDGNANILNGGDGDDTLFGLAGDDTLNGGNGDNVLEGGLGADTLNGGVGNNDAASYINATSGVTATLITGGPFSGTGGEAYHDKFTSIEKLIGSNHADTLTAALNSSILGMDGNDAITVSNSALPRLIDGGAGSDTVTLSPLSSGPVSLSALASLLSNVETLNIRDGVRTDITLSGTDIQHIVSNGVASSLTILANSGDTFNLPTGSAERINPTSHDGHTDYTIYNSSTSATVAVVHWQVA